MPLTPESAEHLAELSKEFAFQGYIAQTENRAITLKQLRQILAFASRCCSKWRDMAPKQYSKTSGKALSMEFINLYHLNSWMIMPATQEHDCAFVELLTSEPQPPAWFVSHWWGERHAEFVACVARHVEVRGTTDDSPYWTCAYANRQHSLASDVSPNPRDSSFYKAIQISQGVLLVLDGLTADSGPATPFTRIWCAFEESISFADSEEKGPMLLDIASFSKEEAELITDGMTPEEKRMEEEDYKGSGQQAKAERELSFPLEVMEKGLTLELQHANASVEVDKTRILNCLTDNPLDADPPKDHPKYDEVNRRLRARFAIAAWPGAVTRGIVANLHLPAVLAADQWREQLELDLSPNIEVSGDQELSDEGLASVGQGLPCNLKTLRLLLGGNHKFGDAGLAALASGLPASLETLVLDMTFCTGVGDSGLAALGQALPSNLRVLELRMQMATSIGDAGLAALAAGLPATLVRLELGLHGVPVSGAGVVALSKRMPALSNLEYLGLMFHGQQEVTDASIAALMKSLPTSIKERKYLATSTGLSHDMMMAFGVGGGVFEGALSKITEDPPEPAEPAEPAMPSQPEKPRQVAKKTQKSSACVLL